MAIDNSKGQVTRVAYLVRGSPVDPAEKAVEAELAEPFGLASSVFGTCEPFCAGCCLRGVFWTENACSDFAEFMPGEPCFGALPELDKQPPISSMFRQTEGNN